MDCSVDKQTVEDGINTHKQTIDKLNANIARLNDQLDHLDYSSPIAERKAADMEARLDKLYTEVSQYEQRLEELYQRLFALNKNLLTKDKIMQVLKVFTTLYDVLSPIDKQTLIRTLIAEIEIYPEKQPNGRIIKRVHLAVPVVYDNDDTIKISWDKNTTVESVVTMVKE